MARRYKSYLLLFFLLFSIGIQAQDSLKVVSYNLQGMKPGTYPETRLPQIITRLIALDPDIIGLQEINQLRFGSGLHNQGRIIADSLSSYFEIPYYYYQQFTHYSWDDVYNEYIGIITKLPVLETGFYQLATGVFPRKVVWNLVDTPIGKISFLNTHLTYNSSTVRQLQVQQIMDYISLFNPEL
jgi:endonuclease/exonuclease/phosphatase family metal-dependent hydrolase